MAREPALLDDSDTPESTEQRPGSDDNTVLLDRRSYLRIAGAATAATIAATTGVGAREDYETITLSRGERRTFEVGNGETFENKLIDCTAGNCWPVVVAHGTDWTIRNVGIEGRLGNTNAIFGVSDRQGNTSVMENIYLGDGAVNAHRAGLGIWVAPQHSGHIDMRNINVQEMGDNSFYCSAPGGAGGGTIHIDNCYSANSWVSHFRLAEGRVTNSVAVNDSRHKDGRGVWAWSPGLVEVDNCHLPMNGRHYSLHSRGSRLAVSNTEYDTGFNGGTQRVQGGSIDFRGGNGTNPRDFVPDGCPTSAAEAAAGSSSDTETTSETGTAETDESESEDNDNDVELQNTIVIDGRDAWGTTSYEFAVTDGSRIEPSTADGATIAPQTTVDDGRARGVVVNGVDAFRFGGSLEDLSVDGNAAVRVDGREVDPADV